jgi:ABC-type multidrug transport system ATPase subunit
VGSQRINEMEPSSFRNSIGFVSQHDPPFWGLTPREVLTNYASLESDSSTRRLEICKRVHDLLKMMKLDECADVVIRPPQKEEGGISGGQLKRVAIATVLLRTPSILILG